ncbi:MAG: class I SAM-dependent methyltransferase [Solirubrobacteraceae bacterium]
MVRAPGAGSLGRSLASAIAKAMAGRDPLADVEAIGSDSGAASRRQPASAGPRSTWAMPVGVLAGLRVSGGQQAFGRALLERQSGHRRLGFTERQMQPPRQNGAMADLDRRKLGRVFDEVPEAYDRVRPTYPGELFGDLVAITGVNVRSAVLEVGCGTGQATRSLAALGCSVTAVEPGAGMAAVARRRLASFRNVEVETSTFEEWNDRGRRFDVLVAASAWHWVDPSIGWPARACRDSSTGWMALLANVVVRRPGEPEVHAETTDLHQRHSPGNADWGHPPLEDEVRVTDEGWGLVDDPGDLFGPTIVRWYPTVQWFDGDGFADLLRTTSIYRRLDGDVRESLLGAIAEHIRTRMGDRASRRYLSVLRVGQRRE